MAGRGLEDPPVDLLLSVKRGLNLDDTDHQRWLISSVREHRIRYVCLDPVRSVTACTDQSFRELRPFVVFLRTLQRETGAVICLVHHDTKPQAGVYDDRDRPHRMSGGGLFSVVDSPIHVKKLTSGGEKTPSVLLTPSNYKFSASPPPLRVRLVSDDPTAPTTVRLDAAEVTAGTETQLEHDDRVLAGLREHSSDSAPTSTRELARRIGMNRTDVAASCRRLLAARKVSRTRQGKAFLWTAAATLRIVKSAVNRGTD
jgi:hypothetical protein